MDNCCQFYYNVKRHVTRPIVDQNHIDLISLHQQTHTLLHIRITLVMINNN